MGRITNPLNGASHSLPICDRLCVFCCLVIKVQMTSNNIELIANMKPYAHKIINNWLETNFFVYIKGHKSDWKLDPSCALLKKLFSFGLDTKITNILIKTHFRIPWAQKSKNFMKEFSITIHINAFFPQQQGKSKFP